MNALPIGILVIGDAHDHRFVREALSSSTRFEVDWAQDLGRACEVAAGPCHEVCIASWSDGAPEMVRQLREVGCISPVLLLGEGEPPAELADLRSLGAVEWMDRRMLEPVLLEHVLRQALRLAEGLEALHQAIQEIGQLSTALAALPDGVVMTDALLPDHPVIFVNPAFERITGYRAEEAIGRNLRFLQGADTDRRVVEELGQALGKGQEITRTLLNYRKDGTAFWNQMRIVPVYDTDGSLAAFVALQRDVSAERETAERLRANEDALVDLLDGLAHPALIRQQGRIVRANLALARCLGETDPEALSARPTAQLVVEADQAVFELERGRRQVRLVGTGSVHALRTLRISHDGRPALLDLFDA